MSDETTVVDEAGNVAHELCRATSFWPTVESDVEEFINELTGKVNKLSEEEYNGMPKPAQAWFEEAVEAKNNGLPVPDLPGLEDVQRMNGEAKPEPRVAADTSDEDPKAKAKRKRAEKKGKTAAPADKTPRKLSGSGKVSAIAKIMLSNPDATVEDIRNGLKKAGMNAADSVVPTFRSAFRNFLSMAAREGKLSKDMKITY